MVHNQMIFHIEQDNCFTIQHSQQVVFLRLDKRTMTVQGCMYSCIHVFMYVVMLYVAICDI